MAETVHILVLESKTTDFNLIRKSLPDYTLKQAKTRKDLLAAFKTFQPDVILANYNLPRFNGLKTLQLVQEHDPLVPVIILMDASDEEIAVNCIKAGANNYILKENIIRLGPAILHALDERKSLLEHKQADAALQSSDEQFRNVFETAPVGIGIADLEGNLLVFNDAMLQPGGYSRADIQKIGSVAGLYYDSKQRNEILALFRKQGFLKNHSIQFKRKDGTPYDTLLSLIHTTFNSQPCIQAIVQDVTEHKRAEEELRYSNSLLSATLESTTDGMLVVATNGTVTNYNKRFLELWGIPADLASQKGDRKLLDFVLQQLKDPSVFIAKVEALYQSPDATSSDELEFKDGRVFERYSRPQRLDDLILGRVWSFRDITTQKQSEESLHAAEARYRNLVEKIPAAVYLDKPDNTSSSIYISPQIKTIAGYSPEDYKEDPELWHKLLFEEDYERAIATVTATLSDGRAVEEYRMNTRDGNMVWVRDTSVLIRDENGQPQYIQGFMEDITQRKHAEIALAESETRLRTIVESEPECVKILGINGRLLEMNQAGLAMIEADSLDEVKGKSILNIVASDHRAAFKSLTNRVLAGESDTLTFEIIGLKGTHRWLETHAVPLRNLEGVVTNLLGVTRDITEHKRSEDILKSREAIMSAVAYSAEQLIRTSDWEEVISDVLAKLGRATEVDRVYLFQNQQSPDGALLTSQRYEWVSPDTEPQINNPDLQNMPFIEAGFSRLASMLENDEAVYGNVQDFPISEQEHLSAQNILSLAVVPIFVGEHWWGYIGFDKCKSLRTWTETEIDALKAAAGNLGSAIQRQKTEETLRESEDRYRDLVENSQILICTHDLEGKILTVNPWIKETLGYSVEDLIKMNLQDALAPVARDKFGAYIAAIRRHGSARGHMIVRTRTGEERVWEYNNSLRTTGVEEPIVRGIAYDVTERKQAEAKLQESEEKYKTLFNFADDAIFIMNHTTFLDCNTTTEKIFRCSKDQIIGHSPVNFSPELQPDGSLSSTSAVEKIEAAFTGEPQYFKWVHTRLDGTPFDAEVSLNRVFVGGEFILQAIVHDITDRKQAEDALRNSEERFRLLFDRMLDGVYRSTREGRFVDVNPAMVKMFGYASEEEMLKVDIKNDLYFAPDERGSHLLDTGQEEVDVYRMRRKDGSEIWVEDHGSYVHDEQGNVSFHEGILRDITERKLAESALKDSILQFRTLFEASPDAIMLIEPKDDWVILDCNTAACQMNGYERDELIGQSVNILNSAVEFPNERQEYLEKIKETNVLRYETAHQHKDGFVFPVEVSTSLIKLGGRDLVLGIDRDITDRKRNEDETLRHLKEMRALYENGLAVSRLLQPSAIAHQVIATFSQHLSWHHVTIRLRKGETDDLELIALNQPGMGEDEKAEKERRFDTMVTKVGQGLSGWVVQTGQPLRTGNVHAHEQYMNIIGDMNSGLYMPLKIADRVIGVISVESEKADAFTAQDERLLATLASQSSVAIENARLYQSVQNELTERKRAEEALRTSETHYRDLADSITDVMFELDQNLQVSHWNKAAEILTGIPKVRAIERSVSQLFGESKEQAEVEKIYLNVLSNRAPKSFEIFLNWSEERRAYEITAYPSTKGISVVAKDVTERKLTEMVMVKRFELMNFSAHNSLESVMQKMLDELTELVSSSIGFFHFMEQDQTTPGAQMWSTKTLELLNVSASEGQHRVLEQAGVWADALRERRPFIQNDYVSLPNKKGVPEGHAGIIRELVIPIIRNERIMAVMGIGNKQDNYTQQDLDIAVRFADHAWDIIERKEMEILLADERNQLATRVEERTSDLSRANSDLARALRVKDEFLANMSHELRTPLNAILGLSESLTEKTAGPLNEKQEKYLTTISESGHHLLSLINDILDLAKIDAGQIKLDINKVDIKSVCEAGLRMIKQLALKKNQEVVLDIDENIGLMSADERRLKQMLVNLLSNAVKFTPENGKLGLEVRGDQNANQVSFAIWDNGIGIKDTDIPLLFQPFIQLDAGLDREASGTGLGLALVAQMARLHGGSVTVESLPNQGSRFIITLPWESTLPNIATEKLKNTGKLPLLKPEDNAKHTLLLMEDTQEVTMMLKDYLENAGYQVVTAQDGIEGIDLAKQSHPNLILMDVQMPRMNGIEATKRLRADPEFERTPIIALTALAMPNDRELCLAAGMNEYISKPVNLLMLRKIIQRFLPNAEETAKSQ